MGSRFGFPLWVPVWVPALDSRTLRFWLRVVSSVSPLIAMAEMRVAENGWVYTRTEFDKYYGSQSENYWNEATWPHAGNSASDPVLQSTVEIEVGATEHSGNPEGSTVLRPFSSEWISKVQSTVEIDASGTEHDGNHVGSTVSTAEHEGNPASEPVLESTAETTAAWINAQFSMLASCRQRSDASEGTADRGRNPASDPVIQTTAETEVGAIKHDGNSAETAVSPVTVGTAEHDSNPASKPMIRSAAETEIGGINHDGNPAQPAVSSVTVGTAEHDSNPVSKSMIRSAAEIDVGPIEHEGNPAQPAVSSADPIAQSPGPILGVEQTRRILSLQDLRALATQDTAEIVKLHHEARKWLNEIADGRHGDEHIVDMTQIWLKWSAWLATQHKVERFTHDVATFTAEAIANTRDPNRGGRPRVDFVVRLVDGSYCRFHPGKKLSGGAEPQYMPAILPDATRGAAEGHNRRS